MTWALATIAVLLVAYAAFSRRLQLISVSRGVGTLGAECRRDEHGLTTIEEH